MVKEKESKLNTIRMVSNLNRAGDLAQWSKHLPGKCELKHSIPGTKTKQNKNWRRNKDLPMQVKIKEMYIPQPHIVEHITK